MRGDHNERGAAPCLLRQRSWERRASKGARRQPRLLPPKGERRTPCLLAPAVGRCTVTAPSPSAGGCALVTPVLAGEGYFRRRRVLWLKGVRSWLHLLPSLPVTGAAKLPQRPGQSSASPRPGERPQRPGRSCLPPVPETIATKIISSLIV